MNNPRLALVSAVLLSTAALAAPASKPEAAKPAKTAADAKAGADAKGAKDAGKATPAKPTEAANGPAVPQGWTAITSTEKDFRAAFPAAPSKQDSHQDTDAGPAETTTWSLEQNEAFFAVSVTKFPEGTVSRTPPSAVLEGARDGAIANANVKLATSEAITVPGPKGKSEVPGIEYEATGNGMHMSARLLVIGDRLYQIIYVRPGASNEPFKTLVGTFSFL